MGQKPTSSCWQGRHAAATQQLSAQPGSNAELHHAPLAAVGTLQTPEGCLCFPNRVQLHCLGKIKKLKKKIKIKKKNVGIYLKDTSTLPCSEQRK